MYRHESRSVWPLYLSICLKNVVYLCSPLCKESVLMMCLLCDVFFNLNIF